MSERIGFAGLGNMGLPMAKNLLKAGYSLTVYNRDARKAETLIADGATRGEHPYDIVEGSGIVCTMLADDAALESVTLGANGFLERLEPGGIHLSLSTVSPSLARRMQQLHSERGCYYVAAPVFGRPEAAEAQKLWICIAGAPEARKRVRPLLEALGQGIFEFGDDPEAASVVKLSGNFLIASAMEAMAEALTLAEKYGIDRSMLMNMFGQTFFACPIYQNYGKMIADRRFSPVGFEMRLGLKDINLLLAAAEETKMPMPLAALIHERILRGVAKGRGASDWPSFTLFTSEDAGLLEG
jgi:3-hydroxyisobutyrate dehydrogenase-like beta-hydroxyacid dehydrogenase